ncbi:MAG TPA: transglutaminase family protein [Hyphomicrobium sp.]|nr:transglutaminase family protein [Hyphomicrobium sp.]
MLVSISHVTRYTLAAPALYSIQSLRLTPPSFDGQKVASWGIEMPHIEGAVLFRDCFGNMADLVAIAEPHSAVTITARGIVETQDRAGSVRGLLETTPVRVFKRETPKTAPDEGIRALAAGIGGRDTLERMHRLMTAVHESVEYIVGVTHAHTSAAEALREGRGVCQDHAHIFISAARAMGIPARYVNGYFVTGRAEPAEAHHAWAEAWVEGLGWLGFDAANGLCPTDRYIRLACGLDSSSAAPIRGTRRGGVEEVLDVVVEVQQQSAQQ